MRTTIAILLLVLAVAAGAAPLDLAEVRTRVANAPDPVAGDEGMVLYEGRYYTHADGLTTLRVQRLTRVDSEWALEQVSDPRIRFDSSRQRLEVNACRSYLPDGGFVDSPVNAFNEVTPGALTLAVDFLDIKELVITHTGLVPGAILWLDYTLRDIEPAGLPTGHLIFPHGDFPLLEMEIVAEGLYGETVNPEGGLHTLPEGEGKWRFRELPAARGVNHRRGDQLPHVVLSPLGGWEEAIGAVTESLEAALTDTAGLGVWMAEFEEERPLIGDRETLESWLAGIGADTALLTLDDWHWRRAPRQISRVLASSVATPLERLALISAAMRSRGIPARWIFPRLWNGDGSLLALAALGNPLAQPDAPEPAPDGWLCDAVASTVTSYAARPEVDTYWSGGRFVEAGARRACLARIVTYWNLAEGDWRMDGRLDLPPHLGAELDMPETTLREWLETDSTEVSELRLGEIQDSRLAFDAGGTRPLPTKDDRGDTRIALRLPPVPYAELLPAAMNRSHSASRGFLYPSRAAHYRITWILDLPEDMEPLPLEPTGATCPGGSFTATRELEGHRLTVHYDLEHDGAPVAPADYPAFRDFVNAALDPAATRVILRPREEG